MSTEKIPLVSVIIPMFNAAKFIPQTLESLLYQTLKDFEVIIVDDCSTDNSVEVVESFTTKFSAAGINLHLIELPKNTRMPEFHNRGHHSYSALNTFSCDRKGLNIRTTHMIDQIIEYNRSFVAQKGYEPFVTDKYPNKKLAVLSCMDTRL